MEQTKKVDFEIGELIRVKGLPFKVVLFDPFTKTIGLKLVPRQEAESILADETVKAAE